MRFEWDEAKRRSNIAKHEIDFVRASLVFDGRPYLEFDSPRRREKRFLRVAELDGRLIAVAWTQRVKGTVRIISARRARNEEEGAYRQLYG
jgi:uncharacterized DUF497 family protein